MDLIKATNIILQKFQNTEKDVLYLMIFLRMIDIFHFLSLHAIWLTVDMLLYCVAQNEYLEEIYVWVSNSESIYSASQRYHN